MTPHRIAACALAGALFASSAYAAETRLKIYSWAEYFGAKTLDGFTAATGVATTTDVYDSNEFLETKLLAGGSGYDIVFPATSNAERELKAGALAPIDPTKLANYGNLDPRILGALDKIPNGRKLGVPYVWGTVGLAYNIDAIKKRLGVETLDSLDALFKPEIAKKLSGCGIAVLDSPVEVAAVALNYLGADPYGDDKAALAKAGELIAGVAKASRYFDNQRATNDLANSGVCLALVYSGDAAMAQARAEEAKNGVRLAYAIPKEGTLMWIDLMSIPKDAANSDAAYRFIDHVLKPDVAAEITDTVRFPTANGPARALVDPAIRDDRSVYPDEAVAARLFLDRSLDGKALKDRTRMWTRAKSGR